MRVRTMTGDEAVQFAKVLAWPVDGIAASPSREVARSYWLAVIAAAEGEILNSAATRKPGRTCELEISPF